MKRSLFVLVLFSLVGATAPAARPTPHRITPPNVTNYCWCALWQNGRCVRQYCESCNNPTCP